MCKGSPPWRVNERCNSRSWCGTDFPPPVHRERPMHLTGCEHLWTCELGCGEGGGKNLTSPLSLPQSNLCDLLIIKFIHILSQKAALVLYLTNCCICHPLHNPTDKYLIVLPLNSTKEQFSKYGPFWYFSYPNLIILDPMCCRNWTLTMQEQMSF